LYLLLFLLSPLLLAFVFSELYSDEVMYRRRFGSCCRTELLQGYLPPLSRRKASQHVNQEGKRYLKRILLKLICIFLGTRRTSTTTTDFGEGRSISGSEAGIPLFGFVKVLILL